MFHKNSGNKRPKAVSLLVCLLLTVVVTVGTTLALLAAKTDSIVNTFTPTKITVEIEEKFENAKEDVKIKNTGNTDAWIRAAVVITWQDKDGNVYGVAPAAGTDCTIDYDLTSGWVEGSDGFYYWTKPVAANKATDVLIRKCQYSVDKAPVGYALTVEVLGSAIQSKPAAVFNDNWAASGLTVNDSNADPTQWTLVEKTAGGEGK